MTEGQGFTGRARRRKTTRRVIWGDRIARTFITLGGIGTVIAVVGVFAFLLSVVFPLLKGADLESSQTHGADLGAGTIVRAAVDESGSLAWTLDDRGEVRVIETAKGETIDRFPLIANVRPTAVSYSPVDESLFVALPDGIVKRTQLRFAANPLRAEDVPAAAKEIAERAAFVAGKMLIQRLPEGQWKSIAVALDEWVEFPVAKGKKIKSIDHSASASGYQFAVLLDDRTVHRVVVEESKNFMTKAVTRTVTDGALLLPEDARDAAHVLLTGLGDNVIVAHPDGRLWRIDARKTESPTLVEVFEAIPGRDSEVTAIGWLNGKNTLVIGDRRGRISGIFRAKPPGAKTADGAVLVRGHTFPAHDAAVTALAPSVRSRLLAAAYADGSVRLVQSTSDDVVGSSASDLGPVSAIAFSPRQEQVLAVGKAKLALWRLEAHHPEATFHSLFTKVWYEDTERPAHVWQSSSGTDDSEAKLGLVPLIFGTLKATLYSLLFGVPIALLAAIFTSEFMHPRVRARVKPTVELMASLPSVVLGFIAGFVIAPFVEKVIASVIAAVFVVPIVFLTGAYLWQMLPRKWTVRFESLRILILFLLVPVGAGLAGTVGPVFERSLFGGDVRAWLDGRTGRAAGGFFVLYIPVAAILVIALLRRFLHPVYRRISSAWTPRGTALGEASFFVLGLVASGIVAFAAAHLSEALGFDPRGSIVGAYDTRNALIVGIVMGFAIIPIIYTIAEDALSAVPEHLRAASLGAGATRWQTAVRIVLPTAMSGIFSAIMVGLGRAVGETMIVLMAAGNTPIMDWNIFNGFRTLSANIATELPEAVRGSTHYRTLFLAALVLLAMTFVLNTIAESVRRRFKKRTVQL